MGSCISIQAADDQHKVVEQVMREAKREMRNHSKLLLLGSGDSGKSTILKQMRLINSVPFTPLEIEAFRQLIFTNLVDGVRAIRRVMESSKLPLSEEVLAAYRAIEQTFDVIDHQPYPREVLEPLKFLWGDPNVQKAVLLGKQYALPENLPYFFGELPRLFSPSYTPTEQDIVHSRARTTGITETRFRMGKHSVSMIDVGGQKSERRKWIHCFQDVTAILFLVSLSGYDQNMVEDSETNQMQDSMAVWDSICTSPWFRNTSIILFLNKEDLFREKVKHSSIRRYFPDYDGDTGDAKAGMAYFRRRFVRLHMKADAEFAQKDGRRGSMIAMTKSPKGNTPDIRKVYPFFTTATDTDLIRHIMSSVADIIFLDNLAGSHML